MNLCERFSNSTDFKRRLETLTRSKNIKETLVRVVTFIPRPPKKNVHMLQSGDNFC